jgi:hypothetical protein
MPTYAVTIKATVIKTYSVEADNESDAVEQAHTEFVVANEEGIDEKYDQETVSVYEA